MNEIRMAKGVTGCPNDAVNDIKLISMYVCRKKGGEGSVREFIDYILESHH